MWMNWHFQLILVAFVTDPFIILVVVQRNKLAHCVASPRTTLYGVIKKSGIERFTNIFEQKIEVQRVSRAGVKIESLIPLSGIFILGMDE